MWAIYVCTEVGFHYLNSREEKTINWGQEIKDSQQGTCTMVSLEATYEIKIDHRKVIIFVYFF